MIVHYDSVRYLPYSRIASYRPSRTDPLVRPRPLVLNRFAGDEDGGWLFEVRATHHPHVGLIYGFVEMSVGVCLDTSIGSLKGVRQK